MSVLEKKKSKRNKDSHTKNFNRQNFSFVNYDSLQSPSANSTNTQSIFFTAISVLFLYFFLPLTYQIILQELDYDILLNVSNLIDTTNDYTQCSSVLSNPNNLDTKDLISLRDVVNKIKLYDYCI